RGSVTAGTSTTLTLSGHTVLVQSTVDSPDPGTHHVFVRISPRASGTIKPGTWEFTLTETAGAVTDVHCWIEVEKTDRHPRFTAADQDRRSTLTPPGTARRIISVANYDHADSTLAESSSRGPTTDSRTGYDTKPDVAAPGTGIVAAKAGGSNSGICCDCCSNDFYTAKTGTSMAAPHVTGIIALMLERNRDLTWEQIRAHLRDSAHPPDPITGPTLPTHERGARALTAEVAVASVPAFVADGEPVHLSATINDGAARRGREATAADGTTDRPTTDRPTTDRPTTASPRRPSPVPVAQLRAAALRS